MICIHIRVFERFENQDAHGTVESRGGCLAYVGTACSWRGGSLFHEGPEGLSLMRCLVLLGC